MADNPDVVSPSSPGPLPKSTPDKTDVADSTVDSAVAHTGSDTDSDPSKTHANTLNHARAATKKEQDMTLWQGIKLYPKAIAWSILISTCIVMEGYDISLVNNFCTFSSLLNLSSTTPLPFSSSSSSSRPSSPDQHPLDAFPQFNKKYGVLGDDGTYQVPARWQAGLSNVSSHPS